MNGPQHYTEAERLLGSLSAMSSRLEGERIPADVASGYIHTHLAKAQVHATLAAAAAQVTAASASVGSITRLAEWSDALR